MTRFRRTAWIGLPAVVSGLACVALFAGPTQAQPAAGAGHVAISCAPRWGTASPGAWTTYAVRVRNDGAEEIDGDVVLVAADAPGSRSSVQRVPGPQLSLDDGPRREDVNPGHPLAGLAIGQTAIAVPSVRPRPPPPSFPAYRVRLTLAPGAEKVLTIPVVEAPNGYVAKVRSAGGRTLRTSVPADPGGSAQTLYNVAMMSDVPGADTALAAASDYFGPQMTVTALRSPRDVPADALGLAGLHAVVIAHFDTAGLDAAQRSALEDFVALGGSLVVTGGETTRAGPSLPAVLTPLRPDGTASASLAPLADLASESTRAASTVVTGTIQSGRAVVQAVDGPPLVVQAGYGAGRVIQLAYDPLAEPFTSDRLLQQLAWGQGLSRALSRWGVFLNRGLPGLAAREQVWSESTKGSPWPALPLPTVVILAVWALTPLTFLAARSRRRPGLTLCGLPVAALAVSMAVVAGASGTGTARSAVEVRLVEGGTTLRTVYRGVQALAGGERTIRTGAASGLSTVFSPPVLQDFYAVRPAAELAESGYGGGEVSNGAAAVTVSGKPWQVHTVESISVDHGLGLETHLHVVGTAASALRITGTLTNRSTETLRTVRAQLPEGAQARLAGVVAPGETVPVDAPLVAVHETLDAIGPRAAPTELVMFAAAGRAFTRPGQVAVVAQTGHGGTGRKAGADGSSLSVVVQAAPLDASESPVAFADNAHLVSSHASSPTAWVDVYELGGIPGSGPVDIAVNADAGRVGEVYDWGSGSWRPLVTDHARQRVPLGDSEVSDGLVRIRIRETGPYRTASQLTTHATR